ncbi:MAG: hypothetical protein E6J34_23595 [Chloroflexi bacterium]|nr:MAG: hypothetical protein E6J34_23595 [Chloroflexota bacterium]
MDNLTQAKELLLKALARVREEAEMAETRRRAKEAEQAPKRKKQPPKSVPPLCLGAAKSNPYEAIRAYERKLAREREEARRLSEKARLHKAGRTEKTVKTRHDDQRPAPQVSDDLIQGALSLLESRRLELEQIQQREQGMSQELGRMQARRTELEQAVEAACVLAKEMLAILEAVAQ